MGSLNKHIFDTPFRDVGFLTFIQFFIALILRKR